MKSKQILHIIFLIFICFAQFACKKNSSSTKNYYAEKGFLDLSDYHFQNNETIELKGDWEFYWQKLYSPGDLTRDSLVKIYLPFSTLWNNLALGQKSEAGIGYATYKLKVKVNKSDRNLGIKFPGGLTAYKLWCNNRLILQNGKVGKSKEESSPEINPKFTALNLENDTLKSDYQIITFVMQLSNFHSFYGGTNKTISIGNYETIYNENIIIKGTDFIVLGILLMSAIYHFLLFVLRRKDQSSLIFTLICASMALRLISIDEKIILIWFPSLDWLIISRLAAVSSTLTFLFIILFIYIVFKQDFHKLAIRIIQITYFFISILYLFLPVYYFSMFYGITNLILVIYGGYVLLYIFPKIIYYKRDNAIIAVLGMLFLFIAGMLDVLKAAEILEGHSLSSYGLVCYIFSQSYLISRRSASTFSSIEELSIELTYQNENLEQIVQERTSEIHLQKEELKTQAEQLELFNNEILSQKSLLEKQNLDIKGSIQSALHIQKAILPTQEMIDEYFDNFILYRPKDIVSGDFYWFTVVERKNTGVDLSNYQTPKLSNENGLLNSKLVFLAVADCTGHGVPGAFMSMISIRLLNEIVIEKQIHEPAKILTHLLDSINIALKQKESSNQDGLDICLCLFEQDNAGNIKLTSSAAKHNLFLYNSLAQAIEIYKGDRISIGGYNILYNKQTFTNKKLQLNPNDIIYLTTDGLIDQNNMERKRLGTKKLVKILQDNADKPLGEQKMILEQELLNHQKNELQRDDITFLALKFKRFENTNHL